MIFKTVVLKNALEQLVTRSVVWSCATADNDVAIRALHDCAKLGLARSRNLEFVESLLEVVDEGVPLFAA